MQTLQFSERTIDLDSVNENKRRRGEWSSLLEAEVRLGGEELRLARHRSSLRS
jgi:hypothetical protein